MKDFNPSSSHRVALFFQIQLVKGFQVSENFMRKSLEFKARDMAKKRTKNSASVEEGEEVLFEPLAMWLESKGYYSLITHEKKEIGMWIGDLFPSKIYIEPDIVGVRSSWIDTICIEAKVKVKSENLFEILGKCKLWKLITDKVYFAYPKQAGFKTSGFQKMGIGLLEVSGDHVEEVLTPRSEGIWESSKSQELFNQVWNIIRSQQRDSAIQITEINPYKHEEKWNITIRFRNTGSDKLTLTDFLINGKTFQEVPGIKLTSSFPTKEGLLVEPFKEDYIYLEILKNELFNSGSQVEFCLQTKEKGKHAQKIKLL